jgi:hypothetical protein
MVNNDFKILIEFLDRLGPEVSGRSISGPGAEAITQIERFARGECEEDERHEVCEMLRLNPVWIRWLADRVKEARTYRASPVRG